MPVLGPLVSTNELAEVLDSNASVVVLDSTWALNYEGPQSPLSRYQAGHIPGARYFDFRRTCDDESELHDTVCSAEQFEAYAREIGVTDEHLVFYSHGRFSSAARAFWLFRYFGYDRVSVLDGGMAQWRAEGREVSTDKPSFQEGSFVAQPVARLFCDVEGFESARSKGAQIIDARPPKYFSGEGDFFASLDSPATGKPGAFEDAYNLPSGALIRPDGRMLPTSELRAVVEAAGIDPARPTVATCSLGVGAAGAVFALHLLGNTEVELFDGSWEAWVTRAE